MRVYLYFYILSVIMKMNIEVFQKSHSVSIFIDHMNPKFHILDIYHIYHIG